MVMEFTKIMPVVEGEFEPNMLLGNDWNKLLGILIDFGSNILHFS